MSLSIEIEDQPDGSSVLSTIGRLDAHEAPLLADAFAGLLSSGVTRLVLDLSQTVFIDSSALAELVRALKRARQDGGDLVLRNPSQAVAIILELTAFNRAFVIETVDADGAKAAAAADATS